MLPQANLGSYVVLVPPQAPLDDGGAGYAAIMSPFSGGLHESCTQWLEDYETATFDLAHCCSSGSAYNYAAKRAISIGQLAVRRGMTMLLLR